MNTLKFEAELAKKYNYQKLPEAISKLCRDVYLKNIPTNLSLTGGNQIYTLKGTLITNQYNRIVIGDYGAFIEFDSPASEFIIQPGEEYRLKKDYNVKYNWLTINDNSNIKIYYQKRLVDYADYQIDKYYVSVHEIMAHSY